MKIFLRFDEDAGGLLFHLGILKGIPVKFKQIQG